MKWWQWPLVAVAVVLYPLAVTAVFLAFCWAFLGEHLWACGAFVGAALLWTGILCLYERYQDRRPRRDLDLRQARLRRIA